MRILAKKKPLVAAFALIAAPLAAEDFTCQFTTECYETEPCMESAFEAEVTAVDEGFVFASLGLSGNMNRVAEGAETKAFFGVIYGDDAAIGTQLLTRAPDGVARYSVQYFEGPMTISYHGTCEVTHD